MEFYGMLFVNLKEKRTSKKFPVILLSYHQNKMRNLSIGTYFQIGCTEFLQTKQFLQRWFYDLQLQMTQIHQEHVLSFQNSDDMNICSFAIVPQIPKSPTIFNLYSLYCSNCIILISLTTSPQDHFLDQGFLGGSDGKECACMWETRVQFLGWEDPLEKEMATHSSIFALKVPRTEKPGRSPWGCKQSDTIERLHFLLTTSPEDHFQFFLQYAAGPIFELFISVLCFSVLKFPTSTSYLPVL